MADLLTTPISNTVTQYTLDSFNVDFAGQTVTVQISMLDASGTKLQTITRTGTFAELGFTAASAGVLKTTAVSWLKAKGIIN